RPGVYLRNELPLSTLFFLPATDIWVFWDLQDRRPGIQRLDRWDSLLLGRRRSSEPAYFLVVGLPVLLAFGFYPSARAIGRKDVATFITLVFLVANILYVTLAVMVFGEEDHNRYRFTIDAFYVTLLGLLISSASAAVNARLLRRKDRSLQGSRQ